MDLSPIVGKLDTIRRRVRTLILVDGLSRAALVLFTAAVLTFLIDYFIPKVPLEVRWTLALGAVAAVALAVWRFVVTPSGIPLTDDDLALCVERQYPELNDRLISALQLSREEGRFARFNSPELVNSVVSQALSESDNLDFSPVVLPAGPRKLAAWTCVAALALVGFALWQTEIVRIWATRLFSDSVQWPKKTTLKVVKPGTQAVTIAKGEDLAVEVHAAGVTPRKATIYYKFSSAGEEMQRPMRAEGNIFRFEFPKVIEPIQFRVEAGDDETGLYEVSVLNPPGVERIVLFYEYPAYTGLKNTEATNPEETGNIKAPVGTRVRVNATTNLDIARAKILFGARGEEEVRDLEVKKDAQGLPRLVVAEIDVARDSHYAIWLQSTNGLQTNNPVRYSIKATDDKAPEIRVAEPNADKFATPQAEIPVRLSTTDDFGVMSLQLVVVNFSDPKRPQTVIPLDPFNADSYPSRRIDTEYHFKMPDHLAKPGMIFKYHIIARDAREIPKANETKTREYVFTVITRDEMLKKMEEMLVRIREEVARIIAFQETGRADVNRLMDVLGKKDTLEAMERQSVNASAANQRKITQHLERVVREFGEIVRDMRNNKLFEGQAETKLMKPGELLEKLAGQKSPEASTIIAQAASVVQGKDRLDKLATTAVMQDEILADLNTILALLTEYETYMEVVRMVRDLLNKSKSITNDIRNAENEKNK